MGYIDKTYYDTINVGNTITQSQFNNLEPYASAVIDIMTFDRIQIFEFDNFSDFTKARIKKATAYQLDTILNQGGLKALTGGSTASGGVGFTLSKFSMNSSGGSKTGDGLGIELINGIPISPLATSQLTITNLLYSAAGKAITLNFFV